ncbi:MAG: hypothetical protein QGF81_03825, partial [Dehalococcoidia bacterium]|nr:hypothetical protein [Dehalococcoidia bacterium]
MAVDLTCTIGGIKITPCLMNAPGAGGLGGVELDALSRFGVGAVVTPPIARQPQPTPPAPYYHEFHGGSMRSPGLGVVGHEEAATLLELARQGGKPVMACISAAVAEDFAETAKHVASHGAGLVLLDFSCRAAPDNRFIGYNIKLSERVMTETRSAVSVPLGVKVPIFLDYLNVETMARAATNAGMDFVVAVSPAGTALSVDASGQPALRAHGGLGEMAGTVIKHMALANVRVFYQVTSGRLTVIGSGGVSTGQDALEFLLAGASGVQVGTALSHQGRSLFTELEESLSGLLAGMGFDSAASAVGKMR